MTVQFTSYNAVSENVGSVVGDQYPEVCHSVRIEHPAVAPPVADGDHVAPTAAVDAASFHRAPLLLAVWEVMRPVHLWRWLFRHSLLPRFSVSRGPNPRRGLTVQAMSWTRPATVGVRLRGGDL